MKRRNMPQMSALLALIGTMICGGGCVERTITLESDPPGALVYLNDQEVGRTPLTTDFEWYGNYDVTIRREGYQTLKTQTNVPAPWWQWIPFDLFAELLPIPLEDHQHFVYSLQPASTQPADPQALHERAVELREQLEGSKFAPPTTQPATSSYLMGD